MTERTVAQVRELRRQGWSVWKVARELGETTAAVRYELEPFPTDEELAHCRAFDEAHPPVRLMAVSVTCASCEQPFSAPDRRRRRCDGCRARKYARSRRERERVEVAA